MKSVLTWIGLALLAVIIVPCVFDMPGRGLGGAEAFIFWPGVFFLYGGLTE